MKKSKIVVLLLSLALLFGVGKNNLKLDQNVGENNNRTIMKATEGPVSDGKGKITFGTKNAKIDKASVTATDDKNNNWTITTVGTESFTQNGAYSQVGSKNNPATSINFNCIFSDVVTITKCSIKLGGNSGTAGDVNIKFGDITAGTGSLIASNVVIIESNTSADSNEITISITNISKGVNVYSIDYEYVLPDSVNAKADINSSNTKAQLKYSFSGTQVEGVSSFVKVTEEPTDWKGDYLIVYEAGNVAFDGSLTSLDAVKNTKPVTISDNNIIKAEDELMNSLFTISTTDGGYLIQSKSGYYIGKSTKGNGLQISDSYSNDYINTISCKEDDTIDIISSFGAYLRYNAASDQNRFRYYASGQKPICLYKLTKVTETKYTFFNMKMNLGAVIETSKVQALVDAGLSISSYGVAVAQKSNLGEYTISDAVSKNSSYVGIVSKAFTTIDAMQKTDANGTETSGDYVIFNANLSFPDESKYNVEVSAVAFFKLGDGSYVFLQERSCSVASLAQEYVKSEGFNGYNELIQKSLNALAEANGQK